MTEGGREDDYGIQLGKWIRAKRTQLGLTQAMLAGLMDVEVDPNWITQLEGGRRSNLPARSFLEAIARAFKVPLSEVLEGAGVLDEASPADQADIDPDIQKIVDLAKTIEWSDPNRYRTIETLMKMWRDDDKRG